MKKGNKIKLKQRKKISVINVLFLLLILMLIVNLVFKNKESLKNIFIQKNKQKATQSYTANDLKIGDIVYYDHKRTANYWDKEKQRVTITEGDSANPGSGNAEKGNQTFNAKDYNTTWRVWDKQSDGKVILVSNIPVAEFYTKGAIGHIWWEHNAHKISSIFGYGEGADLTATKDFAYKVGSGIDNAPDMTEGDRGNWNIGRNGINVSGARSLTFPEAEKKLGITEESIKNGTTNSSTTSANNYGDQTITRMSNVVQRDIGSRNQSWVDKVSGKAKNNSYIMTDKGYYWEKRSMPQSKYKDILFNGIDGWCGLATNTLSVYSEGGSVIFSRGGVQSLGFGSDKFFLVDFDNSIWHEFGFSFSFRVAVFLQPNTEYLYAGVNEWDIYQEKSENKYLKFKVSNLSSTSGSRMSIKTTKVNSQGLLSSDITKNFSYYRNYYGKDEYDGYIKKFNGVRRKGSGDNATFSEIDNKYNVEVTGIPSDYDFKIVGKYGKQIDLDTDTNSEYEIVIYPKPGKYKVPVEYVGGSYDNTNFSVYGNVSIKVGYTERSSSKLTLKRGVSYVEIDNVDLFDSSTNTLRKITDIKFNKSYDDNSPHTVIYDPTNKKLKVTYVPKNKNITVSVDQDSKKYLSKISEIRLRLVGGTNKSVTLRPYNFTSNVSVPEKDDSGRPITYRLEKVAEVPGYYMKINGYTVSLKPIIKLPYTGTELSKKNIAVISLGMFGVALAFRFRKKIVLMFKEYTIMK